MVEWLRLLTSDHTPNTTDGSRMWSMLLKHTHLIDKKLTWELQVKANTVTIKLTSIRAEKSIATSWKKYSDFRLNEKKK